MNKILTLIVLLLLVFLLYTVLNKKTIDTEATAVDNIDYGSIEKAKKITKINANQINSAQIEPVTSSRIRIRIPDLNKVLNNIEQWKPVLNEEDFKIIRELQAKVNDKKLFNDYDNILVTRLEDRNIINAIKQNNPALVVKDDSKNNQIGNNQSDQSMPEYQPEPEQVEPQQPAEDVGPVDPPPEQPEYVDNNT